MAKFPFASLRSGEGVAAVLARGATGALAVSIVGVALSFGVQVLLARVLGVERYGVYIYALSWMNMLLFVARLDFDNASIRFIGAYGGLRDWGRLRGFLLRSHQIVGAIAVIIALLGVLVVWVLYPRMGAELAGVYWAVAALLPLTALLQLQAACLQGLKRVVWSQLPHAVLRPLLLGTPVAVGAVALGWDVGPERVVWLNVAATTVSLGLAVWFLLRALPHQLRDQQAEYRTREWLGVATSLLVISFAQVVLSQQADVFIIGTLLTAAEAGVYSVAAQIALPLSFGFDAVLFIAGPMIAELFAQKRFGDVQRVVSLANWGNLAIAAPALVLVVLAGRPLMRVFGAEFVAGYPVLVVLAASHMASAVGGGIAGYLVTMTGHHRAGLWMIGSSALINIIVTLLLVPLIGVIGAALGTLVATVVRFALLAAYIRSRMQLNVLPALPKRAATFPGDV